MVEILVALLITTIGALGAATLQINTLRINSQAMDRTIALNLLRDMRERIYANPMAYAGSTGSFYEYDGNTTASLDADCLDETAGCTPAEMAQHDVAEWRALITTSGSGLPVKSFSADTRDMGTITYNGTTATHTILIQWDDRQDTVQSLELDVRIPEKAP